MKSSINDLLCCPSCEGGLDYDTYAGPGGVPVERMTCQACGKKYENRDGYPDFLNDDGLVFRSRREKMVRSVYAKVYTPVTNFMFLFCGGAESARDEVMSRLKISEGSCVLETGMGYGENFLWLSRHSMNLRLFGVDIQKEMMSNCSRNLLRWRISADIVRANAQNLPFRAGVFDTVFHLGAINLFEDKKKAIEEMIRVSKPGSHIVIADETEKAGRLFNVFTGPAERITPPIDLIPASMQNIRLETIWRGYGYVIEFDTVQPAG
jgi:ubiquinone/menaquinone biosynthesis C-methylase UbiE